MVRKFLPFDAETITAEFRELESPSREKLMYSMERYQESFDDISPAQVKGGFPDDILEIRHENGRYKGRGLFFEQEATTLVLLVVFRKESQKTPQQVIELAKQRKQGFLSRDEKKDR